MHIHILGIGGTFMGSLAQLAQAAGHRVTGSDLNIYPPMSTQLEEAGIEAYAGFDPDQLRVNPDIIVVGNVVSRGNPVMEEVLDRGLPYISGPQWLAENILRNKWVLAVAGTHGKTTTSSMLAWILEYAGFEPGYLIGGVPGNFSRSARLGESDFFVIEADEYDTAFFDKRSKFVHYHARTLVINNLEYDHADIFPDLAAIQTQFHHLVRTVPRNGMVIHPQAEAIENVLARGCWTETQSIAEDGVWHYQLEQADGGAFAVHMSGELAGTVRWPLSGRHNVHNAIGAIAAARHVGVPQDIACRALCEFAGVKRRMELIGEVGQVKIYDDFAHHPTAIATTLEGLRARVGDERIIAVIEPRSNTMKQGVYKDALLPAVAAANEALWFQDTALSWSLSDCVLYSGEAPLPQCLATSTVFTSTAAIVDALAQRRYDQTTHIVVMSNGGFQGIYQHLLDALRQSEVNP